MAHLTKKKQKARERNNLKRAFNGFNTGVRVFKSKKDYQRKWSVKDYLA